MCGTVGSKARSYSIWVWETPLETRERRGSWRQSGSSCDIFRCIRVVSDQPIYFCRAEHRAVLKEVNKCPFVILRLLILYIHYASLPGFRALILFISFIGSSVGCKHCIATGTFSRRQRALDRLHQAIRRDLCILLFSLCSLCPRFEIHSTAAHNTI